MREKVVFNMGKWNADYDERGNCIRVEYDEGYQKLMGGVAPDESEFANRWRAIIHPDDLEMVDKISEELFEKHPEGMDYDFECRMKINSEYRLVHDFGHCTRNEEGVVCRIDGVIFDIQDIADGQKNQKYEQLRAEVFDYMIDHDDDPVELLKNFSSKLLDMIECDQIIYRDLEETRIMINSDAIKDTWSVPIEFCKQCEHFNAFHPMYKDGYTEMENCQEGWKEIPVYHECPIKSSLTRIVYCDGEVAGYLAIHYVVNYHHFTDSERKILEVFARILSISLSRYKAKNENKELKQIKQMQAQLGESLTFTNYLMDTFINAYYVDLDNLSYQAYKKNDSMQSDKLDASNYLDSINQYIEMNVHPDDRQLIIKLTDPENMKRKLAKKKEYSQIFRDISDGVEKIYRMQVIRGAEENHAAFWFIDISKEVNEQKKRSKEIDSVKKLVESVASSYDVAVAVNMEDDTFALLKNNSIIPERIEEFETFSRLKEELFNVVHENDKDRVRNELEFCTISEKLISNKSYNVEFRMVIEGATSMHEMNITLIDDNRVAIGFANKDVELTKLYLEEKRYEEYFALFVVDADTNMIKIIKNSPWYNLAPVGKALPYSAAMLKFASALEEEYQGYFIRLSDMEQVKKEFKNENRHSYIYRSIIINKEQWVECTGYVILRHDDGTPAMFTLGFSLMDSQAVSRQEMQQQLAQARNAAEEANRSKTTFLFNMSHDIRTPMNAITGFTNMAKKYIDDKEKVVDYLNKIDTSGKQLLLLINQVLEMSRIESGKIELEEKPINVLKEFDSAVTVLGEQAKGKGLEFIYSVSDITHTYVLADTARMSSITLNITGNAMKYTPRGGRIEYKLKEIEARKEGYATFVFSVVDTGIGMSEEYMKVLFDPFTREKNSTVSKIQGTGLGMSIVKDLVELMGGNIDVKSEMGKGTRFDITVDFKIVGKEYLIEDKEEETIKISLKGKRVLLVEDNELNREIAVDILQEEGIIVEEAEDGTVAVNLLRENGPDYYDIILMDIQMPIMNGYDATEAIRDLYPNVPIPIIALSANAFSEDKEKSIEAGMDDHVAKPINSKELFETMIKYL